MSADPDATGWRRVGLAAGGLGVAGAVLMAAFIASQGGPSVPAEPERAIALPALYAATGLIAALAAHQGRRVVVGAAGALFMAGSIISAITVGFLLLGVVLLASASRIEPANTRGRGTVPEWLIASTIIALVVVAAVGLLATTEERCSVAFGPSAQPVWQVVPCDQAPTAIGGPGGAIATSFDSGALSEEGLVIEAVALLSAVALAALPVRARRAETNA